MAQGGPGETAAHRPAVEAGADGHHAHLGLPRDDLDPAGLLDGGQGEQGDPRAVVGGLAVLLEVSHHHVRCGGIEGRRERSGIRRRDNGAGPA